MLYMIMKTYLYHSEHRGERVFRLIGKEIVKFIKTILCIKQIDSLQQALIESGGFFFSKRQHPKHFQKF